MGSCEAQVILAQDGSVKDICKVTPIVEMESLAILGKKALEDVSNTERDNYTRDHVTEADLGLKLKA